MGVGRGVAVCQTLTVFMALPFWWGEMEHKHMVLQVMMRAWGKGFSAPSRALRKLTFEQRLEGREGAWGDQGGFKARV